MMVEFNEDDQVAVSDSLTGPMTVGEVISVSEEGGSVQISIELENGRNIVIQKYKEQPG